MPSFPGFPSGKTRLTPLPAAFFTDLLPAIDHLGELKVTLYAIWHLDRQEGRFRSLRRSDFAADARFMQGMGKTAREAESALDEGLSRSVGRGVLLAASLELEGGSETLYVLNTPKGRAAVDALAKGQWRPTGEAENPVELALERPGIFRLYEANIGPLTPLIADELKEAEKVYPQDWIEDAVRLTVENNKRSWRYVEAILRRWQEKGRDEERRQAFDRRDTEKDRRRYAQWEDPEA